MHAAQQLRRMHGGTMGGRSQQGGRRPAPALLNSPPPYASTPHWHTPQMPCLQKAFRVGARPGAAPAAAPRTAAEEAELQRVLEEEIVREMQREAALAQVRRAPCMYRREPRGRGDAGDAFARITCCRRRPLPGASEHQPAGTLRHHSACTSSPGHAACAYQPPPLPLPNRPPPDLPKAAIAPPPQRHTHPSRTLIPPLPPHPLIPPTPGGQETDHEERKRMLRQFAAEREAAKVRILAVGYTAN